MEIHCKKIMIKYIWFINAENNVPCYIQGYEAYASTGKLLKVTIEEVDEPHSSEQTVKNDA